LDIEEEGILWDLRQKDRMLVNTFLHIPSVGRTTEKRLWENQILCWDDFLSRGDACRFSGLKFNLIRQYLHYSKLNQDNIQFFKALLPHEELWRVFDEFQQDTVYLDIETTGLHGRQDDITVIGLYDGKHVQSFIHGINLEQFVPAIKRYKLIVTFNGSCFDLPFIEAYFKGFRFFQAHIDLRFFLKCLGYSGGLKKIEQQLGICRDEDLQGMNGYDAVKLWQKHLRGDRTALQLLVRYNAEDVINLKTLMETGYRQMRNGCFPYKLNLDGDSEEAAQKSSLLKNEYLEADKD
jgi:uncharacterized protein YprB with RNaseH-like and TPR domain